MARSKSKASKLYVGKVFSLKKNTKISIYRNYFKGFSLGEVSYEDLGHVLILNENGKAVEVWTPYEGGMTVWFAKFYLHSEIKEEIEGNPHGELGKVITELSDVATRLRDTGRAWDGGLLTVDFKNELEESSKKLNKLIRRVRLVQETLESKRESG